MRGGPHLIRRCEEGGVPGLDHRLLQLQDPLPNGHTRGWCLAHTGGDLQVSSPFPGFQVSRFQVSGLSSGFRVQGSGFRVQVSCSHCGLPELDAPLHHAVRGEEHQQAVRDHAREIHCKHTSPRATCQTHQTPMAPIPPPPLPPHPPHRWRSPAPPCTPPCRGTSRRS